MICAILSLNYVYSLYRKHRKKRDNYTVPLWKVSIVKLDVFDMNDIYMWYVIAYRFPNRYKKTVDELYRVEYEISGQNLTLEILDTSGYYQFPAMRELAIRKSEAFILVFSVDSEESLEELKQIREDILRIKKVDETGGSAGGNVKIPMVVVANKCDIDDDKWKVDRTYVECLVSCEKWLVPRWEFTTYCYLIFISFKCHS